MTTPIKILSKSDPQRAHAVLQGSLEFGREFADLMVCIHHSQELGWHDAAVTAFADIPLSPAAKVLHYAQEIFEGLKAYRWPKGEVALFRHRLNAERLNASARRMALPEIPVELQIRATEMLVDLLRDWVPGEPGSSLYLRPTLIGTDRALGLGPARTHLYFVIASPVGSYFTGGFTCMSVMVEEEHIRAAPGGVGEAKTGGNYAASLIAHQRAYQAGFAQVLFLDAVEHRYVEELGGMNVFMVIDGVLATPGLGGTILAGITRRSILECAPDLGIPTEERPLAIAEIVSAIREGRLTEMMAVGTAAVITPIGELGYQGERYPIGAGEPGPITRKLHDNLTGIQRGQSVDPYGWMQVVPPASPDMTDKTRA